MDGGNHRKKKNGKQEVTTIGEEERGLTWSHLTSLKYWEETIKS